MKEEKNTVMNEYSFGVVEQIGGTGEEKRWKDRFQ